MDKGKLLKTEQLCRSSIEAGITRLCEVGAWPRPPAARRLRAGRDFYYGDLEEIEEVNKLIQYLASDDKIQSLYFSQSSTSESWRLYWFWQRLFLSVLRETQGMKLNKMVFKGWFKKFIKELYSDTAVWRIIDTITGLDFRAKKLRLDNDVTTLTSTPGYNFRALIGELELDLVDFSGGSPGGYDKATIITTMKIPKQHYAGVDYPHSHLLKDIERSNALIEAIRLTKTGMPRLHCHIMVHLSDFPLCEPLAYCMPESTLRLYEKEAIIDRGDFQKIKNLWREIMKTRDKDSSPRRFMTGAMSIALSRFYKSYEPQSWLEDIVDLTVALESLFKPKDSNQELSYRIAMRAAWLLGRQKDDEDSVKVYDRVKAMYDIRSSTVHGGTPDESKLGKWLEDLSGNTYDDTSESYHKLVEPAVESARDIVRRAIRACMKLSELEADGPHWPFPPKFDENIIIASQRRVWQEAAGIRR